MIAIASAVNRSDLLCGRVVGRQEAGQEGALGVGGEETLWVQRLLLRTLVRKPGKWGHGTLWWTKERTAVTLCIVTPLTHTL